MKVLLVLLLCVASTIAEDEETQEFTNANNKFASTVYKEIIKSETGNLLVSPFSAEVVLAFTQSGSKDETAQQIRTATHLSSESSNIETGVKNLLPKLKESSQYTLHTANKMYVKNNFEIKNEFKEVATKTYFADIENIDFVKNVEAAKAMNDWVEKQTANKIRNLIDPNVVNNDTRLILINALYFKADWSTAFHLVYTKKISFHKTDTEAFEVDAMHNKYGQQFLFYECNKLNAKFLELPFKGKEASMTFILPNELNQLSNLENDLDAALVPHNVTSERVKVSLPKFKIESKINLKTILKKLGVITVFTDFEADLSGIAGEKGDLVVNEVVQKSYIDVNEKGVEAAAATFALVAVPMMGYREKPKEFIADHPFIFYIRVKGVIVFVGRVTDPRN